jgi:hypothetical protein
LLIVFRTSQSRYMESISICPCYGFHTGILRYVVALYTSAKFGCFEYNICIQRKYMSTSELVSLYSIHDASFIVPCHIINQRSVDAQETSHSFCRGTWLHTSREVIRPYISSCIFFNLSRYLGVFVCIRTAWRNASACNRPGVQAVLIGDSHVQVEVFTVPSAFSMQHKTHFHLRQFRKNRYSSYVWQRI